MSEWVGLGWRDEMSSLGWRSRVREVRPPPLPPPPPQKKEEEGEEQREARQSLPPLDGRSVSILLPYIICVGGARGPTSIYSVMRPSS